MQRRDSQAPLTHIRPTRLIRHPRQFLAMDKWKKLEHPELPDDMDIAAQPTHALRRDSIGVAELPTRSIKQSPLQLRTLPETPQPFDDDFDDELPQEMFDISRMSTSHLMKLSGMMQAIKVQRQTGVFPAVNFYRETLALETPSIPKMVSTLQAETKFQPRWKTALGSPTARIIISLIVGIVLLFLMIKSINLQVTVSTITKYLLTPLGVTYALIAGGFFIASFSVRGIRWKLFLNPIGKVSTLRAIQLFWIGVFINFLLPVRGGELAKSLMLKRIASMPISQTLPTVAMDKALDLMPALVIMAIVPLLPGVHMKPQLWFVLIVVASVLAGLIFFIALAAWKRTAAIGFMKFFTRFLPKKIGDGIEGFATGFVDSLLAGASQPKIFLPAMLLTIVAVMCDGLFAMFAFWAVGLYMPFGVSIFGYTVFNMFCILPNAPAGIGSNEVTGAIVFTELLGYNPNSVQAMFAFSHPWTTLLMTVIAVVSLSSLGLTLSSAMKMRTSPEEKASSQEQCGQVQPQPVGV
ncbi:MAG: hypothetical protein NVS4B12_14080 [Ktedonobacteraceae bacterium]